MCRYISWICVFLPRRQTTQLAGENTAAAVIVAYHLEAISHHSAPNWTVCVLHFHFPLSALSASLREGPEKWHSASHWASSSSSKAHTGATHGRLESSLLCGLVRFMHQREGQQKGESGCLFQLFKLTFGQPNKEKKKQTRVHSFKCCVLHLKEALKCIHAKWWDCSWWALH